MIHQGNTALVVADKSELTTFRLSVTLDCRVDVAFDFCTSRAGFVAHFPHEVDRYVGTEQWSLGDTFAFRYRMLGIRLPWAGEVISFEKNRLFRDRMTKGTFKKFEHTHIFEERGDQTLYTDSIEFTLGFGSFIDRTIGRSMIGSTFAKRHRMLANALNRVAEK